MSQRPSVASERLPGERPAGRGEPWQQAASSKEGDLLGISDQHPEDEDHKLRVDHLAALDLIGRQTPQCVCQCVCASVCVSVYFRVLQCVSVCLRVQQLLCCSWWLSCCAAVGGSVCCAGSAGRLRLSRLLLTKESRWRGSCQPVVPEQRR